MLLANPNDNGVVVKTSFETATCLSWFSAGMQLNLHTIQRQRAQTHSQQSCRSMQQLQTVAPVADLAEGLEAPVQLVYLATLLGFLVVGAYLVVRQVYSIPTT